MRNGADADHFHQTARFSVQLVDQISQGVDADIIAYRPDRAAAAGITNRLPVLRPKINDIHGIGDQHLMVPVNNGVTVRVGVQGLSTANTATAARYIDNHQGLRQQFLLFDFFTEQTCHRIGASAGFERHNNLDRFFRVLRQRGALQSGQGSGCQQYGGA